MPNNKNANFRYLILDRCFRNTGRKYRVQDLIEECNHRLLDFGGSISSKQIYEDIKFMQRLDGFDAPIARFREGKSYYYRYTNPEYSIQNLPIKESELQVLNSAIMVLSRIQGLPHYEWLQELIPRLSQRFIEKPEQKSVIAFEENEFLVGRNYLGVLFHAIVEKQSLKIEYQSFDKKEATHTIFYPYYLKQSNKRWFCIGYEEAKQEIRLKALDRFLKIEKAEVAFIPNMDFDIEEYFSDIIGVTNHKEKMPQKVLFSIHPIRQPYIETKPLHESQKKLHHQYDKNGWQLFEIKVKHNKEMETLFLGFGDKICMYSPDEIRLELYERLKSAAALYENF